MPWNLIEIQRDWLCGIKVALSPMELVDVFNSCEVEFGRPWLETHRRPQGSAIKTWRVHSIARGLELIKGMPRSGRMIDKLRHHNASVLAELQALQLLAAEKDISFELYPPVSIRGKEREADFVVKKGNGESVFVEVTMPDTSAAQKDLTKLVESLIYSPTLAAEYFDLEVFLTRDLYDSDVSLIADFVGAALQNETYNRLDLPRDLGTCFLGENACSYAFEPKLRLEPPTPGLGLARVKWAGNHPCQRIVVHAPFSDSRAERMLRKEAEQLPEEENGLVMVNIGNATGGFTSWEPLIRSRFSTRHFDHVSAVCLFENYVCMTPNGLEARVQTRFLPNEYSRQPLPSWIEKPVKLAGASHTSDGVILKGYEASSNEFFIWAIRN